MSTTITIPSLQQLVDQAGGNIAASSWNAFLTTPTGQQMLAKVEQSAQQGVQRAAADNALNLMVFALAGGTVGGAVFRGPLGFAAAAALAVWAGSRILANARAPASPPMQGLMGLYPHGHCSR